MTSCTPAGRGQMSIALIRHAAVGCRPGMADGAIAPRLVARRHIDIDENHV